MDGAAVYTVDSNASTIALTTVSSATTTGPDPPFGVAMLIVVLPTGEITELIVGGADIRKWREKK